MLIYVNYDNLCAFIVLHYIYIYIYIYILYIYIHISISIHTCISFRAVLTFCQKSLFHTCKVILHALCVIDYLSKSQGVQWVI